MDTAWPPWDQRSSATNAKMVFRVLFFVLAEFILAAVVVPNVGRYLEV